MTTQIHILPSGHEFVSEGNSTLLEAGLRAGLRLGYGCSNGNCGKCLAKVVSGEVQKVRPHDYVFSRQEIASGHMLMCCNSAVSDVVLQAGEASSASEIPQQQITAKVKNINIVNDNVALIHLRTPRTNRLRFLAGQHVQLGVNGTLTANYPVGSCPCDDMHLHFQIPRIVNDEFSEHVFSTLRNGDLMEINGPTGNFILDEDSRRPLIFIAERTGFGPIRSLVEHAMALETEEATHLVWVAENKQGRFLDNLCRSWADALDDFHYVPLDSDAHKTTTDLALEIIHQIDIEPGKLAGYDCYIAGTEPFVTACRASMINGGLPEEQMNIDRLIST